MRLYPGSPQSDDPAALKGVAVVDTLPPYSERRMRRWIKPIFNREQVGFDWNQLTVFCLGAGSMLAAISWLFDVDYRWPVSIFLFFFGFFVVVADLVYVAISTVLTRGHWRQYGVYVVLNAFLLAVFTFSFS